MRSVDEIRERIRGVLTRELDQRVAQAQKRLPHRCVHNHRHTLDTRKAAEGEDNEFYNRITTRRALPVVNTIGLCMLDSDDPESWSGTICEDPIDAQKCPVFEAKQSKEEILLQFQKELAKDGWVEAEFPEVAALLWAIEYEGADVIQVPWWKALWHRWVLRIRVEPVVAVRDVSHLLAPKEEPKAEEKSDESVGS